MHKTYPRGLVACWTVLALGVPCARSQQPENAPPPALPPLAPAAAPPLAAAVRQGVQNAAGLGMLVVPNVAASQQTDKEDAGLPASSKPELLTWERVYALAILRARAPSADAARSLDLKTLAEAANRHGVADFARFRTEFLAPRSAAADALHEPSAPFLELLRRLVAIDRARRNVALHENLARLFQELVQGSSGLDRLDVDLAISAVVRARDQFASEIRAYQDSLDEFKVALGLSPRAYVLPDRESIAAFGSAFDAVDAWLTQPRRRLDELPPLIARLPSLGDIVVNERPLLRVLEGHPEALVGTLANLAAKAMKNRPAVTQSAEAVDRNAERELKLRRHFRRLCALRRGYESEKTVYELTVRLKDQAFERLVAPRAGQAATRSALVSALLAHEKAALQSENQLVTLWTTFRAERVIFYRELGALPYNDWGSFYGQFRPEPGALSVDSALEPAAPAPPAVPPPAPAPPAPPPATSPPQSGNLQVPSPDGPR